MNTDIEQLQALLKVFFIVRFEGSCPSFEFGLLNDEPPSWGAEESWTCLERHGEILGWRDSWKGMDETGCLPADDETI